MFSDRSLVWYFCNHRIKAWNHFTKESVPPAVINLYFFLCSDFISDKKDIYYFTLLENTLSWWHHASRLQMSILCLKEFLLFKESKIASSLSRSSTDWLTWYSKRNFEVWRTKYMQCEFRNLWKQKSSKFFTQSIFSISNLNVIFFIFSIMLSILIMNTNKC